LGDAKPKYINGPESPIFSKKRNLYAIDLARAGLRNNQKLVVAEGYMDVIALHQAGFTGAVAPLGTALTEEQLEELWRLAPDPVLCFDGDAAGAAATARTANLCLPLLTPERRLRIARLPSGDDPDTLIRKQGPAAFKAVIETAPQLSETLYDLVREQSSGETAEQRAVLRARLDATLERIADKGVRNEFRKTLNERFNPHWARTGKAKRSAVRHARSTTTLDQAQAERGRCLVAILLRHPDLLRDVEEAFTKLALTPAMARLRDAVLHLSECNVLDSTTLLTQLNASGVAEEVAQALSSTPDRLPACAHPDAMPVEAEAGWWHLFGLMHRARLDEEVVAASRIFTERPDEVTQRRLIALRTAQNALPVLEQDAEIEP